MEEFRLSLGELPFKTLKGTRQISTQIWLNPQIYVCRSILVCAFIVKMVTL